jgi:hypothetical protein
MHSNVRSNTIRRFRPRLLCGYLLSLFWILLLAGSQNMQLQRWRVGISLFPSIQSDDKSDRPLFLSILGQFYVHGCCVGTNLVPSISSHGELNQQLFLFIPTDISDHGFSGGRAQNWPSIVACVTNSTQNSTIYKLRSGAADWLTRHCTYIVLCPPNSPSSFCDIQIHTWNARLAGWRLPLFMDTNPYEVFNRI